MANLTGPEVYRLSTEALALTLADTQTLCELSNFAHGGKYDTRLVRGAVHALLAVVALERALAAQDGARG